MANNYHQATVSPELPATLFHEDELRSLEFACGLTCERAGDNLYFFAGESFGEEGEDEDGQPVNCLTLMQEKLKQLDPVAYPHIVVHGAATCSKMRPDEFGGFAHIITRDDVRSVSTWQWLYEQAHQTGETAIACQKAVEPPGEGKPYSVLLLYPDHINDSGTETFYAFVQAADPIEAVAQAQRQAAAAQEGTKPDPDDFAALLVTQGHHPSEPLFNK